MPKEFEAGCSYVRTYTSDEGDEWETITIERRSKSYVWVQRAGRPLEKKRVLSKFGTYGEFITFGPYFNAPTFYAKDKA